jgi:diguanylate cyclase (GGDEF)-like protein
MIRRFSYFNKPPFSEIAGSSLLGYGASILRGKGYGKRRMRRVNGRKINEFVLAAIFAVCLYFVVILTDAHERFALWSARHEEWELDELLVLLGFLSVALAVFAWRRWREANAEVVQREELQRKLEHLATHDALTDLPNRALFMDRLEHAIERAIRERVMIAVLFIDLDGFKAVNDAFGYETGDRLLAQAAGRLKRCVRSADTVSRIGGDEFVVLVEGVEDAEQVVEVAGRIAKSLGTPFALERGEASVSASIGVSLDSLARRGAEELLREADRAMYRAKGKGGDGYEISGGR